MDKKYEEILKNMTLREKIGQTVMLQTPERYADKMGGVKAFLEKYPIGGIYMVTDIMLGGFNGVASKENRILEFEKYSKYPLIISGDVEYGYMEGDRSELPYLMSLGATHDRGLAYKYGQAIARAAKNYGLNCVFSPVADLNINPDNPIVNIRSIGDDPEEAGNMVLEIVHGIQDGGIAATGKHFPGLGSEGIDAHIAPCDIDLSKEQWDRTTRVVYEKLINEGVYLIMTTHASLPAYQSEADEDGVCPAATLSYDLTTKLLKEDLGFQGVVVTDALEMGGFSGANAELEVESFMSGNDIILWPSLGYMDLLDEKILSGKVPIERLDDAVGRIWDLKERLGLLDGKKKKYVFEEPDWQLGRKIAKKALTLLNNKLGIIPFNQGKIKKALVVKVTPNEKTSEHLSYLKTLLEVRGIKTDLKDTISSGELVACQDEYDLIIFAISRTPRCGCGTLDIFYNDAFSVTASQSADRNKTVVVSFGTPYMYTKYYKRFETYVNAYYFEDYCQEAFIDAIFGEAPFTGRSPVKL